MKKQVRRHWLLLLLMPALLAMGCSKAPDQKVFVLGIDGFTFDLLMPWAQEGKLPNFARLLEEGSATQLISTIPPTSPPAWTSAITGLNPGKHGIFGFVKDRKPTADGGTQMVFYTARDRMADPLWVILSERGRRSVVVNVPISSPPDKIKGIMVSGFPHPSLTNFTYPPEYRLKIPDYRKDVYGMEVSPQQEQPFLEDLHDIADRRAKLILRQLDEEQWDLFFVVFTITDRIQHYFWKFMDPEHPAWDAQQAEQYGDAIFKAYKRMDDFLGQLESKLDDRTTLLVMSDHGFGPVYQMVNGQNFVEHLKLPDDVQVIANDTFGPKFHLVTPNMPLSGQTTRESLSRAKKLLKKNLEELRDPATGQKVIQEVFEREDLFWGPYADMAPHILALEKTGYRFWNGYPTEDGNIFPHRGNPLFKRFFSGAHKPNGVLIMAKANVRRGVQNFDAQILDIAPTVLYLLGEPVPEQMDGNILSAPISEQFIQAHPLDARWARTSKPREVQQRADSTEVINAFIEEQLKAIGYVQ